MTPSDMPGQRKDLSDWLPMKSLASESIFLERDNTIYYITNWKLRKKHPATRAKIIRLSAFHLQQYNALKEKGRSQRYIFSVLFGESSVDNNNYSDESPAQNKVTFPVDLLTAEQLHALICERMGRGVTGIRELPLVDLRRLLRALSGQSNSGAR